MSSLSSHATVYLKHTRALVPDTSTWELLIAFVDQHMEQDGGHDWGHLARVFANARAVYEGESTQRTDLAEDTWEVIAVAALCHDIINLPKDDPERHRASTFASEHTFEFLAQFPEWEEPRRSRVADAIRCHSFSSGFIAETPEAQILSDADRLDALGAIGIARTFFVGGKLDRPILHPTDPLATHRVADDGIWSVDHFFCKLLKLRDLMYTNTGRVLAQKRHDYMLEFLRTLEAEVKLPG